MQNNVLKDLQHDEVVMEYWNNREPKDTVVIVRKGTYLDKDINNAPITRIYLNDKLIQKL